MSRNTSSDQSKMSLFVGIVVGAILAVGIGLFVYLWNPLDKPQQNIAEDAPTIRTKEQIPVDKPNYEFYDVLKEQNATKVASQTVSNQAVAKPAEKPKTPPPATTNQETDEIPLDDSEITHDLPDLTDANADDTAVATTNGSEKFPVIKDNQPTMMYFLRIGTFDNADEADTRRAEVLMAGVDAQIVKRRLNDGSEYFEVISQVVSTQAQIDKLQQQLSDNGIDSISAKQKVKNVE